MRFTCKQFIFVASFILLAKLPTVKLLTVINQLPEFQEKYYWTSTARKIQELGHIQLTRKYVYLEYLRDKQDFTAHINVSINIKYIST